MFYYNKKAEKDSILDYLKYIVEHGYYRMHNPIYIAKKKKASPPPKKGTKRYKSELKKQKNTSVKRQSKMRLISLITCQQFESSCSDLPA